MKDIAAIRQEYQRAVLDETTAGDDPVIFFSRWFAEAQNADITEVTAMTLATTGPDNKPHARIVLLKGLENGCFEFFTNYNSLKGRDISNNGHVALVFFWKELERQVRIEGIATQLPTQKSEEYFMSRPEGSRLGAWASPQSAVISSRSILDNNYDYYREKFHTGVPRPAHWGGYAVKPDSIEFWQGRASRMHDRIKFTASDNGTWEKSRLAP